MDAASQAHAYEEAAAGAGSDPCRPRGDFTARGVQPIVPGQRRHRHRGSRRPCCRSWSFMPTKESFRHRTCGPWFTVATWARPSPPLSLNITNRDGRQGCCSPLCRCSTASKHGSKSSRGAKVDCRVPMRGDLATLRRLADQNAEVQVGRLARRGSGSLEQRAADEGAVLAGARSVGPHRLLRHGTTAGRGTCRRQRGASKRPPCEERIPYVHGEGRRHGRPTHDARGRPTLAETAGRVA